MSEVRTETANAHPELLLRTFYTALAAWVEAKDEGFLAGRELESAEGAIRALVKVLELRYSTYEPRFREDMAEAITRRTMQIGLLAHKFNCEECET